MNAQVREAVAARLDKGLLTGASVLSRFRLLDENSRRSVAYTDPRYVPFYHHLGQEMRPRTVVEFGLRLGLNSGTLLRSCGTVEHFLGFQEPPDEFYSPRLAAHNLKTAFKGESQLYVGPPDSPGLLALLAARPWDFALVNEEREYDSHLLYLDLIWQHLALDGSVLIEYVNSHRPAGQAYQDFCKRVNRGPYVFKTRYGTGVVTK